MVSAENIAIPRPPLFITTASGRAGKETLARSAGYGLLPPDLYFIAEEASRREDVFANALRLNVVGYHYSHNHIPNTVHAAANKAEGVDWCYEELKRAHSPFVSRLIGGEYVVMDNQRVMVDPHGKKIAFKKFRTDTPENQVRDIEILIDTMKTGAASESHIEYLSTFVFGIFGQPTIKEYKTVRTRIGRVLRDIDLQVVQALIANNAHITGGIDIEDLLAFCVEQTDTDVRIRKYRENERHYIADGSVVIIDSMTLMQEEAILLPKDHTRNNNLLPALVRGFV